LPWRWLPAWCCPPGRGSRTRWSLQGPRTNSGLRIGLAVSTTLVEQLLRRSAAAEADGAIKPLCIGVAGVFGFELFFYADAMLFAQFDAAIWAARGYCQRHRSSIHRHRNRA
jgi:hypothetical protein